MRQRRQQSPDASTSLQKDRKRSLRGGRLTMIIRWPGRYKAGLRSDALVEMVDLAPTLLEAAGIPIPLGMQGRPLTALLTG